jgi:hypothetical protein
MSDETFDDVIAKLQAREPRGDPEPDWLAEAKRKGAEAASAAVAQLELPERVQVLLEAGGLKDTEAMGVLAAPAALVVVSGTPGCGKTVAAAKWLYDFSKSTQRAGFWLTAARLARWPRYDDSDMERLLRPPRLVLDDLGTEYLDDKGSFMATLDELINERFARKRPTVITTNLNAAAFKARYHERIVDRIREDGRFVSLASPSLRST